MSTLIYILLATFLGSIVSLAGGIILLSREKFMLKISHFLASFAAGGLLGAAFFDLLPEALHVAESSKTNIHVWTLIGILLFFILERFIHWFHHHEKHDEHLKESRSTVPLIIISDTVHNFLDGAIIAATFLTSVPLGIIATLAVITHEIPQEIGDFGLLLSKGMPKNKIIIVNVISAAVALAGALLTYLFGNFLENYVAIFLALTAGFFIYIATSDLIPEINYERRRGYAIIESFLLIFGIIVIFLSVSLINH